MASEVPTRIPDEMRAGDTFKWRETLAAYPASDGWVLHFAFVNSVADLGTHSATVDGDDFELTVAAVDTKTWRPGTYTWQKWVDGVGDEKTTLEVGSLVVHPDLSMSGALDTRSHARKTLEALDALIEKRATKDQAAYSIEGRSLSRMPIEELLRWRDDYSAKVKAEIRKERRAQGRGAGSTVQTYFNK